MLGIPAHSRTEQAQFLSCSMAVPGNSVLLWPADSNLFLSLRFLLGLLDPGSQDCKPKHIIIMKNAKHYSKLWK